MKINTSNFRKDLDLGRWKEYEILQKVKKKYPKAYLNSDYRYDIYVPETGDSIEVKWDRKSEETGNYFIECEFDGEPSGIEKSEATYWVIVDGDKMIWIKTESLKYLLSDIKVKTFEGEGHIVKGYLIKRDHILLSPYAIVY